MVAITYSFVGFAVKNRNILKLERESEKMKIALSLQSVALKHIKYFSDSNQKLIDRKVDFPCSSNGVFGQFLLTCFPSRSN